MMVTDRQIVDAQVASQQAYREMGKAIRAYEAAVAHLQMLKAHEKGEGVRSLYEAYIATLDGAHTYDEVLAAKRALYQAGEIV